MLKFHFLNVGHGDCAIVEFTGTDGGRAFGLVDSNRRGSEDAPALRKLRALGAERLAFIALTHPHADHFRGLKDVLQAYGGNIDLIFTFPIDRDRARLEKFAEAYCSAVEGSEDPGAVEMASELLFIIATFADLNDASPRWEANTGDGARMYVPAMPGVEISLVLPDARVKGPFFDAIDNGQSVHKADKQNHLSMAIRFRYAGQQIILGGDGTYDNWLYVRKRTHDDQGRGYGSAAADVVKIPHHGSKHDAAPHVLDYLFGPKADTVDEEPRRIAIVSADGRNHPAPEVLQDLQSRGIEPYCTGLSRSCSGGGPSVSVSSNVVDPALVRFIAGVAEPSGRPPVCQGDIVVTIPPTGPVAVTPQFDAPCGMRSSSLF